MNEQDYKDIAGMTEERLLCELAAIRKRMNAIDAVLQDAQDRHDAIKLRLEYLDKYSPENCWKHFNVTNKD